MYITLICDANNLVRNGVNDWIACQQKTILLRDGDVHLWCAFLDNAQYDKSLEKILSEDELARAARLIQSVDCARFIHSKIILRQVLARYLAISPEKIQFKTNQHGKPFIPGSIIQFNLSHSGDCVFIGVTLHQYIGVDVEKTRKNQHYLALAKRFFTASEYTAINNMDDFYRCWTRKEAFIKATGLGLSFGLSNFEVAVSELNSQQSALISINNNTADAKQWMLQSIMLDHTAANYFAAVAVQNNQNDLRIICRRFVVGNQVT